MDVFFKKKIFILLLFFGNVLETRFFWGEGLVSVKMR